MAKQEKPQEKLEFAKGIFVREFAGGEIINISINVEQFYENPMNENGYISVDIRKSKKNGKRFCTLNTWKPDKK